MRAIAIVVGLIVVVIGVAVVVGVLLVLRSTPDNQAALLEATPGYDLELPNADELRDNVVKSLGNAGANRTRTWGVVGAPEDVAEFLEAALTDLGYTQESGQAPGGDLGTYRRDDARFEAFWVDLPHRIAGGRFISGGYDFVVYTTISNGERAERGR